jgi:Spy/CpxP family protein refolding chaperone
MTTKRNLAIAVAAALGVGLALNAGVFAHGRGYSPGYGGGHMMGGYGPGAYGEHSPGMHGQGLGSVWRLDLTDAQADQVAEIQDRLREQHLALRDKLQDQYRRLRDLNAQQDPDRAAVDKVYDKIFQTERRFAATTLDAREEVEKVLTDEQKRVFTRWRRGAQTPPCPQYDRQS